MVRSILLGTKIKIKSRLTVVEVGVEFLESSLPGGQPITASAVFGFSSSFELDQLFYN